MRSSMSAVDSGLRASADSHQRKHEQQPPGNILSAHPLLQRISAAREPSTGDKNARKGFGLKKSIVGLVQRVKPLSQARGRCYIEGEDSGNAYWDIYVGGRGAWDKGVIGAKESSANDVAAAVLLRWAMVGMGKEEEMAQDSSGDQVAEAVDGKGETGTAGV